MTVPTNMPANTIELLSLSARTSAGVDAYGSVKDFLTHYTSGTMVLLIDAIGAGSTLTTTLQESYDYVAATPAAAHWSDTAQIGTDAEPVAAVGGGSYEATFDWPPARQIRLKYKLTGTATFGVYFIPNGRTY